MLGSSNHLNTPTPAASGILPGGGSLELWPSARVKRPRLDGAVGGAADVVHLQKHEIARPLIGPPLVPAERAPQDAQCCTSPTFGQVVAKFDQNAQSSAPESFHLLLNNTATTGDIEELLRIADTVLPALKPDQEKKLLIAVAKHKSAPLQALHNLVAIEELSDDELATIAKNPNADASILENVAKHPRMRLRAATAVMSSPIAHRATIEHLLKHLLRTFFVHDKKADDMGRAIAYNTRVPSETILAFAADYRANAFYVGLTRNPAEMQLTSVVLEQPSLSMTSLNRILHEQQNLPMDFIKRVLQRKSLSPRVLTTIISEHFHPDLFQAILANDATTDEVRAKLFRAGAEHPESDPSILQAISSDITVDYRTLALAAAHAKAGADIACFQALFSNPKSDAAIVKTFFANAGKSEHTALEVIECVIRTKGFGDAARAAVLLHPNAPIALLESVLGDPETSAVVTAAAWIRLRSSVHNEPQRLTMAS